MRQVQRAFLAILIVITMCAGYTFVMSYFGQAFASTDGIIYIHGHDILTGIIIGVTMVWLDRRVFQARRLHD